MSDRKGVTEQAREEEQADQKGHPLADFAGEVVADSFFTFFGETLVWLIVVPFRILAWFVVAVLNSAG